ncbi:MAG: metal-dependent transcriptional regulator [Spirochaetota bacterium]|nr:metal-dependent transcriptional regulator [Spirochaetota bacterium]
MTKNNKNSIYFENTELSSHMEDYLEIIATISRKKKVVRVKDIARGLNIKMPSVTSALNKLMQKGLVNYEKYGFIELTEEGEKLAERVYSRHRLLIDFFNIMLRIDREKADEEACRIEHHLSPLACKQIYKLLEFYKSEKDSNQKWTVELRKNLDERLLSDLKEGDTSTIVNIKGSGTVKKRLHEMGFRKGEQLKIIQYAPLKDPIKIAIKDFYISLRIDEAKLLVVKPLFLKD